MTVKSWRQRLKAFEEDMDRPLKDFTRYKKWFRGDFADIDLRMKVEQVYDVNMVALVAKSRMAHLFFNSPRVVVRSIPGRGTDLADVETSVVNDVFLESDFWTVGRRVFMDAFLAPYGVFKVGYSADVVADPEFIEKQRERAHNENMRIASGQRIRLSSDDYDAIHLESHDAVLELANTGELELDEKGMKRIKKHVQAHRDQQREKGEERVKETLRGEKAFITRVKPSCFAYDIWADSWPEVSWAGEMKLRILDDVKESTRFSGSFIKDLKGTTPERISDKLGISLYKGRDGIDRILTWDLLDLRRGKVVTIVDGPTTDKQKRAEDMYDDPIREEDYTFKDILPSGPYLPFSFTIDPDHLHGISQVKFWEKQQEVLTVLHTVETETAKRQIPRMVVNSEYLDDQEMEDIKKGLIALVVSLKNMPEDGDVKKVIQQLESPEVNPQTFAIAEKAAQLIAQLSGMGTTRLAGGDRSRTATASALIDESIGALTGFDGVSVDKIVGKVASYVLRIVRYLYDPVTVARSFGAKALELWPQEFSVSQILDDRGVEIVVGSMRRETTSIQQKLMGDLYAMASQDPAVPPTVRLMLLDYILRLSNANVSLTDFVRNASDEPMPQQEGVAQETGGGGGMESMAQAMANTGGGRLPSGGGQ
jgi:hypothetical protein